jgi:hypothetical protein
MTTAYASKLDAISGTNTGDQTISLTGDVTGSGTGSFSATIANDAVTYAKMQNVSAASKLLGRGDSGSGDPQEITLGSGLSMSGTTLNVTSGGTGTVTSVAVSGTDGIEVDSGSPITSAGTIQLGVNAATMKTTLDLAGTNTGDITLAGTPDYITISGQTITRNAIDLAADVTGTLPAANGGTGITTLGTGVATALGVNVGSAGAFVTHGGALGTPSSGTATNLTGTASGLTAGEATAALGLKTATTTVAVSSATAPTSGQVLTATSSTAATWQTPSGGGGGLTNITETLHTTSPNNTVNAEQLEVTGGSTNVDLVLTPKGTGAFILGHEPDNTTTGGNKRGAGAVDLQLFHHEPGRVASGAYSVAAGYSNAASGAQSVSMGLYNNASGAQSVALGYLNTVSGTYSAAVGHAVVVSGADTLGFGRNNGSSGGQSLIGGQNVNSAAAFTLALGNYTTIASGADYGSAFGFNALSDRYGMKAEANGAFAAIGDNQAVRFLARNKTTTNSAVELFLNGSSARLTIPSGKIFSGTINILGSKSDGSAVARYIRQVTIKNVSGTTSLVGSVITIGTDDAAGTSISITANDANDALKIEATGVASETWRWIAVIEGAELAYGN